MKTSIVLAALGFAGLSATTVVAQVGAQGSAPGPEVQRGQAFAQTQCAACHAIGRSGESPLRTAPPFRTLHLRYPVENLAESLAEGIMTAHPAMPQVRLEVGEIGDFIAYLKTLERRGGER